MSTYTKRIIIVILILFHVRLSGQDNDTSALFKGSLDAAVISAQNDIHTNNTRITITPLLIKTTPSHFGEADPLKIILSMPGIQNSNEGDVGLSIRGGDTDQSLISLDGVPIYNPSHLKGFVSSFNSDIISKIDVYSGAFPAQYGSRLSGVVNVESISPDMTNFYGGVTIGMLSSKIHLGGPIIKNKTSFFISARKSYFPLIIGRIYKNILKTKNNYIEQFKQIGYYDINGGVTQRIGSNNSLDLKFYIGDDNISLLKDKEENSSQMRLDTLINSYSGKTDSEKWGNTAVLFRWKSESHNLTTSTYSYYTRYRHENVDQTYSEAEYLLQPNNTFIKSYSERSSILRKSEIEEYALGADFNIPHLSNHTIAFGGKISLQNLNPVTHSSYTQEYSFAGKRDSIYSYEAPYGGKYRLITGSLYGEDDISVGDISNVSLGLRLTYYGIDGKHKIIPEPRIRGALYLNPYITLKVSYSRMSQAIHQLASSNIASPSDLWVPATADFPPMTSDIVTLGLWHQKKYGKIGLFSSIEGYYKLSSNNMEYADGYSPLKQISWEDGVELGHGKNYGVEFQGKINYNTINSSISYTLSKSVQQFDNINNGEWFFSNQDCRHNLTLWLSYSPFKNFTISSSFYYKTGRRFTVNDVLIKLGRDIADAHHTYDPHINNMYAETIWLLYDIFSYSEKNGYKMEDYHRLDLSFDYMIPHKKVGRSNINLSFYNLYNHMNPYKITMEQDPYGKVIFKKLCIFPFMPSISYSFEF